MARAPPRREFAAAAIIGLLRRRCWASVPIATIESLINGGRVIEFPAAQTVYAEADTERLAVVLQGLFRVYMHASDGRQVTVRYVRAGDLLGVPALVGGLPFRSHRCFSRFKRWSLALAGQHIPGTRPWTLRSGADVGLRR
jgi:CRP-like cAMP-binding protein